MTSPSSPSALQASSSALLSSSAELSTELLASLHLHASQSVDGLEARLSRALRALAPLERALDDLQERVEGAVHTAEKDLELTLRNALRRVQGASIHDLAQRLKMDEEHDLEKEQEPTNVAESAPPQKKKAPARRSTRATRNTKP